MRQKFVDYLDDEVYVNRTTNILSNKRNFVESDER